MAGYCYAEVVEIFLIKQTREDLEEIFYTRGVK
jgi:hypothetical protein